MESRVLENDFYSIVTDGFELPVRRALEEVLKEVRIRTCQSGLIIYSTRETPRRVSGLRFVRNSFLLLRRLDVVEGTPAETVMAELARQSETQSKVRRHCADLCGTFRVIVAVGSRLVHVGSIQLNAIERLVSESTGLRVNRSHPVHQFWIHLRSEGIVLFSLRLTNRASSERILEKGELRPEVADILCRLSEPEKGELFLDPFAGSGAIPITRALNFPLCRILASDADEGKAALLKAKVAGFALKKSIIVRCANALRLDRYEDNCIDKIVTDPPWGAHSELPMEPTQFYARMLSEFHRILKPGGLAVIMIAREHQLDEICDATLPAFACDRRYDILLSGQKASVYVFQKH